MAVSEHAESDEVSTEIGKTYQCISEIATDPNNGRRAVIVESRGSGWCVVRWANGVESVVAEERLQGPVEPPLRPGVEEPCAVCDRSGRLKVLEPASPDKPWLLVPVGEKDCPNCSADNQS